MASANRDLGLAITMILQMKSLLVILRARPSLSDIRFFVVALIFRPWEITGILKREAARIRNGTKKPHQDSTGLRGIVDLWEGAHSIDLFEAQPRSGGVLIVEKITSPTETASALQFASKVNWRKVERSASFPVLSLEAARLGLRQSTTDPLLATSLRSDWLLKAHMSPGLRRRLYVLSLRDFEEE